MGRGLIPSFSEAQSEKQAGEGNDPKDKKKVVLSNKAKHRLLAKAS